MNAMVCTAFVAFLSCHSICGTLRLQISIVLFRRLLSFSDQAFLSLKGETVFQDVFRRNPPGKKACFIALFLNLTKGVQGGIREALFTLASVQYFKFHDDGGSLPVFGLHDDIIAAISAFLVGGEQIVLLIHCKQAQYQADCFRHRTNSWKSA